MSSIENDDDATAKLEAALYSAGRPLSVEELIKASGTESRKRTLALLTNIMKKTKSSFKALEIVTLPDGSYVFQLKPEYNSSIRRYASKPILPSATTKPTVSGFTKRCTVVFKQFISVTSEFYITVSISF